MGISTEVLTFFEACLLGFLLGMLYDVFRILRLSFPNGKVLIFFEDILYFAVAAVASFSFIVLAYGGVLRAFLIVGELLGAILYFFSLSIVIMKAAQLIIRLVHGLLRFLFSITIRPLCRLFVWLAVKCRNFFLFFRIRYKIIALNHKKHLKPTSEIVYNDGKQVSRGESDTQPTLSGEKKWKGRNRSWQDRRRKKIKSR